LLFGENSVCAESKTATVENVTNEQAYEKKDVENSTNENESEANNEKSPPIDSNKEEILKNETKQRLETPKENPQKMSTQKIKKIEYIGCQRIDQETVASYLPVGVGDLFDDNALNESLKILNATYAYEEVGLDIKDGNLVVKVKEYPIIEKISFEGNKKINNASLKEIIKLKSHETLSPTKIREIQQGLLEQYRKMGRYNASINPKIIRLDNNRVNLVFEINEGDASGIRKIVFIGNKNFSQSALRDAISSKIKRWYRFFVTDDIYDSDRLNQDKALLSRFYKEHGYADFKILSCTAELSSDKKGFILTFSIKEGEIYKISDIDVKSHIEKLDEKELKQKLLCKKGDRYNIVLVDTDLVALSKAAGAKGFASIKVIPIVNKEETKNTLGIVFHIMEEDKVYISKIVIKGNTRTRDHVIRREIPLQEGDAFNESLLSMAENNIRALGFFKTVDVNAIPDTNSPDRCVVQVNVEEQSTGQAVLSVSYSTATGFGAGVTYSESNFFGTGRSLSVSMNSGFQKVSDSGITTNESSKEGTDTTVGVKKTKREFKFLNNVVVRVAEPHLFDTDVSGSITLHRNLSGKFYEFTTDEIGAICGVSYELTPKITQGWDYHFAHRKFKEVIPFASPIIRYQAMKLGNDDFPTKELGKSDLSLVKHNISYGTSFLTGPKGYFRTGISNTFAGVGGDAKHFKNELFGVYVMPVFDRSTIKVAGIGGIMNKIGDKNPLILDSFSLGLDSFRGFDDCGIGPISETTWAIINGETVISEKKVELVKKHKTTAYIGAKKFWKGTLEFKFPLGLPEELQFRGFIFTDFGSIWDAPEKGEKFLKPSTTMKNEDGTPLMACDFDGKSYNIQNIRVLDHKIIDDTYVRASVGFGVSFLTPLGPIIFTYAIPVKKKDNLDQEQRFLVGYSTTF
jgi:outer membrane protein insertion porin family